MVIRVRPLIAVALLGGILWPALTRAEERPGDSIDLARQLYSAAEYENALGVLDRLRTSAPSDGDKASVEQYRAFCLLALGRTGEAEQAIAALVAAEPGFVPSESAFSPRVRATFRDVRSRTLPAVIQRLYDDAKGAFDRHDYAAAASRFKTVLQMMADPDVSQASAQPPLSDLKTLAEGFRDLSAVQAAPPPLAAAPLPVQVSAPKPLPVIPQIYAAENVGITPPAAVRQVLPPYQGQVSGVRQGVLEVIVNENGQVESAALRVPIEPRYDRLVLDAARTWRYKPAMRNGVPVKYRKMVQISVKNAQ